MTCCQEVFVPAGAYCHRELGCAVARPNGF
jgi:hypothetical protein